MQRWVGAIRGDEGKSSRGGIRLYGVHHPTTTSVATVTTTTTTTIRSPSDLRQRIDFSAARSRLTSIADLRNDEER